MNDLNNKTELVKYLKENNLFAKKKLGQNFLIDSRALNIILKTAELSKNDLIIEIGPGLGTLTQELITRTKKVISLELDKALFTTLNKKFKSNKNLELHNIDALKFVPAIKNYKIVANIPYNITSPLLNHFLQTQNKPKTMTLLIQKEVAEKICNKEKTNILNLQVNLFGESKYIKTVKNTSFHPKPKVNSAIIHIKLHEKLNKNFIPQKEAIQILNLAKTAFTHKRKKLKNTLKKKLKITENGLDLIFKELNLNPNIRPEEISVQQWKILTKKLKQAQINKLEDAPTKNLKISIKKLKKAIQ